MTLTLFDTTPRCHDCQKPFGRVVWEAVAEEHEDGSLTIIHVCPGCAHNHLPRVRQLPP